MKIFIIDDFIFVKAQILTKPSFFDKIWKFGFEAGMKKLLFFLFIIMPIDGYTKDVSEELMARQEKVRAQWKYNPFRTSSRERLLFGWQNPNAFITRFWIGGIPNLPSVFPDPNMKAHDIAIAFAPLLATELNVIPFEVGRLKVRIGVGFLADLNFFVYKSHIKQLYGNTFLVSDFLNVSTFIDFVVDDTWKIRWIPLIHLCSHGGGDYFGDPSLGGTKEWADMGYESMGFEFYYNWNYFTFYSGMRFGMRGVFESHYATLFSLFAGADVRIPVWGYLNFIAGFFVAGDYNTINTLQREGNHIETLASHKQWNPVFSSALGLELDRLTFSFKYSQMQSRHLVAFRKRDIRYGFETTIYF